MSTFKPGDRIHYGGAVIGQEEIDAILETIKEGDGANWTIGKRGTQLEELISSYTGLPYTVLTNSGSSALLVGILALNLPKRSQIAIPATCFPTAFNAIVQAGHVPYLIDADLKTFNLDIDKLRQVFEFSAEAIAAVIGVNIAGNVIDAVAIRELCDRYDAKFILDNCDGFGGKLAEVPIEAYADVACTSFHAAHIIAMGEGGAVMTINRDVAIRARQYRDWGREGGSDEATSIKTLPTGYPQRYAYKVMGYNLKPLELQAAMGIVQFTKLEHFKSVRANNWYELYSAAKEHPKTYAPVEPIDGARPCWFSFPLLTTDKASFVKFFEDRNIETRPIFAGNVAKHEIDADFVMTEPMKNADIIMENGVFIGVSPRMDDDMLQYVVQSIHDFAEQQENAGV